MVKTSAAQDTKARILGAAHQVFVSRGTDGARMQEIADRAGVNKSLLHYHFRTKADLAEAVWLRVASSSVPGLFRMMTSDAPFDRKIDQFIDFYFDTLKAHPYLPAYVIGEVNRHPERLGAFYSRERRKAARSMVLKLRAQLGTRTKSRKMAPMKAELLLLVMWSMCLYPFAARQVMSTALGLNAEEFDKLIESLRRELPAFLKRALRP